MLHYKHVIKIPLETITVSDTYTSSKANHKLEEYEVWDAYKKKQSIPQRDGIVLLSCNHNHNHQFSLH